MTRSVADKMESGSPLFLDGTFSVTPLKVQQLFVIQTVINGRARPLAFALMESKDTKTYENLFRLLKLKIPSLSPSDIMLDFEISARNAARNIFPGVKVHGCMFHFCQALRRRYMDDSDVKSLILKNVPNAKLVIKMFMRLAFLPANQIPAGISAIKEKQRVWKFEKKFEAFNKYFDRTWNGTFKPQEWSGHALDQKTNNYMESLNSTLTKLLGKNPSIYTFLDGLQTFCYRTENRILSDERKGVQIKDRSKLTGTFKREWPKCERQEIDLITFLRRMACDDLA